MRIDIYHHFVTGPEFDAISRKLDRLLVKGELTMGLVQDLEQKVNELSLSAAAREQRDIQQDQVTALQIQALSDQVTALQAVIAAGGLSEADSAVLTASLNTIGAVITSLNAADPTPPVV